MNNSSSMPSIVKLRKSWHETQTFEIVAKRGRRFKTKNLKKTNLSAKKSISQKNARIKKLHEKKIFNSPLKNTASASTYLQRIPSELLN